MTLMETETKGLFANRIVFDQSSRREAEMDAGFTHAAGLTAWDKVRRNLIHWGQL